MIQEMQKYSPLITISSSFIVAGSFLFRLELPDFKVIGTLLFFSGVLGVIGVFFGALSTYFLNKTRFRSPKVKTLPYFMLFLKYLFLFSALIIFGTGFVAILAVTNDFFHHPQRFLNFTNFSSPQEYQARITTTNIVAFMLSTQLVVFTVVVSSLLSLYLTLYDIFNDLKRCGYESRWLKKIEKLDYEITRGLKRFIERIRRINL